MRTASLIAMLLISAPASAEEAETDWDVLVARTGYDFAVACMAYRVSDIEQTGASDPAELAEEMVFWGRLVAATGRDVDQATFSTKFAEELSYFRGKRDLFASATSDEATREDVDLELTGMGKECWFQIMATDGGLYVLE